MTDPFDVLRTPVTPVDPDPAFASRSSWTTAAWGTPSQSLYLRVRDVDGTVRSAVDAGARLERVPADHEYGRNGVVVDPFGHRWMVSSSSAPSLPAAGVVSAARCRPRGAPARGSMTPRGVLSCEGVDASRSPAQWLRLPESERARLPASP